MNDTTERTEYPRLLSFIVGSFIFFLGVMMTYDLLIGEPFKSILLILFTRTTVYICIYVYGGLLLMITPILIWLYKKPQRILWASITILYVLGVFVDGIWIKAAYIFVAIVGTIYGISCYE